MAKAEGRQGLVARRRKIVAEACNPTTTPNRPLIDEPLTADDWQEVWAARQAFLAAVRAVVCRARLKTAGLSLSEASCQATTR
jgi:hypothetical protein